MANYNLAPDTAEDLEAIFDYTIDRWGIEQAHRYKNKLAVHFSNIGRGKVNSKAFLKNVSELQVSRCEHHYVFHFIRQDQPPLIVAILHERMDMVNRIRRRLDG